MKVYGRMNNIIFATSGQMAISCHVTSTWMYEKSISLHSVVQPQILTRTLFFSHKNSRQPKLGSNSKSFIAQGVESLTNTSSPTKNETAKNEGFAKNNCKIFLCS